MSNKELQYLRLDVTLGHRFAQDKIAVDFNGHYLQPKTSIFLSEITHEENERKWWWDKLFSGTSWMLMGIEATREMLRTEDSPINTKILDKWLAGVKTTKIRVPTHLICNKCGESLKMSFDGQTLHLTSPDSVFCSIEESDLTFTVELNVDCGELVFGNDFRAFCPDVDHEIETFIGRRSYVKDYAERGMFHVYVGNTCPGVYQDETGIIRIACGGPDEVGDTERFGRRMGSICTDLWWFSAMDTATFLAAKLATGGRVSDIGATVPVTPGKYKMTVYDDVNHDESNVVFAKIEPTKGH